MQNHGILIVFLVNAQPVSLIIEHIFDIFKVDSSDRLVQRSRSAFAGWLTVLFVKTSDTVPMLKNDADGRMQDVVWHNL